MKRMVIIIGLALVAGFTAISIWKELRYPAPEPVDVQAKISEAEKAETLRFWKVYREATRLRLDGERKKSIPFYREALTIDPDHEDALYYFGNVMFEIKEYDSAITMWRRLVRVNKVSARAHYQLGAVYSCGALGAPFDLDIAKQEFMRAKEINPEETGSIMKLGEVSILRGESAEALDYLLRALQSNPQSSQSYYLVGYLHWRAGRNEAAMSALGKALEYSKTDNSGETRSQEGDTKIGGGGPILADAVAHQSLFASHCMALKTWKDGDITFDYMNEGYRKLHEEIKNLTNQS